LRRDSNALSSRNRCNSGPLAMSHPHSSSLEVTKALVDCASAGGFDFGDDTAIVAVQHMLRQTEDLFQMVSAMGLTPKNIFALGKIYSNSPQVIKSLRGMGVTVVESTMPEPGEFHSYFERDVATLWKVAGDALGQRQIKRLLVLDDAGVCITNVPPGILRRYVVCGIEQTTRGMVLFKENPPPFAVISWARAAVKLNIGSPIFSQYLVEKLNTEFLKGESLQKKQLGIIGLGSIGRGVASLTLKQGAEVFFYDPNQYVHIPASLHNRIGRLNSLKDLMLRCDYVVGCSGCNPFMGKWPLKHKPSIKLLSASSGDQEFDLIIRDLRQKPDFKVTSTTWDIVSEYGPSGPIHIAYLGYPYSFVSRRPEALPTEIVQFDTGGLLAALVQARLFLQECENGREQNRGIHRVSPKAQRFVYERWLGAMKDRMIDITDCFGHDPDLLRAIQHDDWFYENSEPHPGQHYRPARPVEDLMDQFICQGGFITTQG
jgi:D-isomer specific 2-hydroxyacid dehydrogenase-like protein